MLKSSPPGWSKSTRPTEKPPWWAWMASPWASLMKGRWSAGVVAVT